MNEKNEAAIERVELLPVFSSEPSEGALTLQALAVLPYANSPTIPSPSTGTALTVPYGSLLNYAHHLIDQAGSPDIRFLLRFHHYFGTINEPLRAIPPATGEIVTEEQLAEMKAQGKILDLNDPDVQRAIQEGRMVIK